MTETISSLQNPLVKQIVALQQKKRREQNGLFVVEGVRLSEELLASGWEIEFGFFTETAVHQERAGSLVEVASQRCRMLQVSEVVFAKVAETDQPQGILFVARQVTGSIQELVRRDRPLLVVLDTIQDPGNLGALLRTADAVGADGVIVTEGSTDPFGGKALRASMGSVFHLPLVVGISHAELLASMRTNDVRMLATALEGASSYLDADYSSALAVIFGNEGKGIAPLLLENAEQKLSIPMYGQAESLNVAAAAAVILYEAARQRRGPGQSLTK